MINPADSRLMSCPVALSEVDRPALEILRIVVEGKRKISGVSAKLLR